MKKLYIYITRSNFPSKFVIYQ